MAEKLWAILEKTNKTFRSKLENFGEPLKQFLKSFILNLNKIWVTN